MEVTIEEMRAVCVTHYVERGHSPDHAEMIVGNDEREIRRIYDCIQKEQEVKQIPHRIAGLTVIETAAE
jgi:hypothetical protein